MRKFGSLNAQDAFKDGNAPWVVVFHGYGADAFDLFPLNEMIPTQYPLNWIFPQGPLEVPIGPGWTGRAWWNINIEQIQKDAAQGVERDLSTEASPQAVASRQKVIAAIETLKVPWNKVILGGFSQGAMLAVDIYLHAPQSPMGLFVWSSALVNKVEWKERTKSEDFQNRLKENPHPTYFQSHGTNDTVLSLKNGQRLDSFLQSVGMKGKMITFNGGHEIPPQVILGTADYLKGLLHPS